MIIFGWGRVKIKDFGDVIPLKCNKCKNSTYWSLKKIEKLFTLFFIPIVSYSPKHVLICPICSVGIELKGPDIDAAKKMIEATKEFKAGKNSDAEKAAYEKVVDEFLKSVKKG